MSADPHGLGNNLLVSGYTNANASGDAHEVLLFNKHSYQVKAWDATSTAYFTVEASNSKGPDAEFLTIADYQIDSSAGINPQGIMYSDDWRFVQCRWAITGHSAGAFSVMENHIY